MDFRDWATALAVFLAACGVVLSIYMAFLNRRATQRRLKIQLTLNVIGDSPEPRTVFLLSAANAGQRAVKIQSAVIRFPDGRQFIPLKPSLANYLPCELREGQNLTIPIAIGDVVQALQESGYCGRVGLRADFRDVLDEHHVSRPLHGNIEDWTRLAVVNK